MDIETEWSELKQVYSQRLSKSRRRTSAIAYLDKVPRKKRSNNFNENILWHHPCVPCVINFSLPQSSPFPVFQPFPPIQKGNFYDKHAMIHDFSFPHLMQKIVSNNIYLKQSCNNTTIFIAQTNLFPSLLRTTRQNEQMKIRVTNRINLTF